MQGGLGLIVLRRLKGWGVDEQRVQAYVALIEKLFACPGGGGGGGVAAAQQLRGWAPSVCWG